MPLNVVRFRAIILMSLALVPAGAHLFELPSKMQLSGEAYFTVQGIYAGSGSARSYSLQSILTVSEAAGPPGSNPNRFEGWGGSDGLRVGTA